MPELLHHQFQVWTTVGAEESEALIAIKAFSSQIMLTENLVVLAGLGASRCIRDADDKELAPTMGDLWCSAKKDEPKWKELLETISWDKASPENIENLLSRCHMEVALRKNTLVQEFIDRAEKLIAAACSFIDLGMDLPEHEAFLSRVARRSPRLARAQIFTTNYDLAFETAASKGAFTVIDGFSFSLPHRFDGGYFDRDISFRDSNRSRGTDWIPNVFKLHKLHGSVDWGHEHGVVTKKSKPSRPLIVYPRTSKFELSYQQPFLELMSRFQTALRLPDTGLFVIGSGLNDRHITEPVMAALRTNVRMSALVVAPDLHETKNEHVLALKRMIQSGDRRVTLLSATFEDFVKILPDLVPPTEAELHSERISEANAV